MNGLGHSSTIVLPPSVIVRHWGRRAYLPVWQAMREYTAQRTADSCDEIWIVEHDPVYTLGLAGKMEHLLEDNDIEVVHSDRGGQITYHGPGQLVMYTLFDLKRLGIGIKSFVHALEESIIMLLARWGIRAHRRDGAPGVYVEEEKIAALGLRVKKGCSYHGLSINVCMDLGPFNAINPCGYAGLRTTQLCAFARSPTLGEVSDALSRRLLAVLGLACGIHEHQPWRPPLRESLP